MPTNIHITLRAGDRLPITGEEVLVRLGLWDPEHIRERHDPDQMTDYERALAENADLRRAVTARYGPSFAVLSVYHRPGPPAARPGTGDSELDSWFGSHPIVSRYRAYLEALSGALETAGFLLLPTDIYVRRETDGVWELQGEGHFDIVVGDLDDETLARVYACFESAGTGLTNPYRRKHSR